jgi:hypothetical protein
MEQPDKVIMVVVEYIVHTKVAAAVELVKLVSEVITLALAVMVLLRALLVHL